MNESTTDSLARLERLEEMYVRADAAMGRAEAALAAIEKAHALMTPVMDAYNTTWLADLEATEDLDLRLAVTGQDSIWELHSRHHELMTRLLRLAADHFAPAES